MTCSDECAVEKADASEFAFFSGVKNGAIAERERIIKLLEFELWETFQKSHNERPAWATMKLLITAIKGENE